VRLHSLGDVVLAAPAAAALAERGSASFIVRRAYLPVVERFHPRVTPIGCDGGPGALRSDSAGHGSKGVVDLQNNLATRLAFPRAKRFRVNRGLRRRITALGAASGAMAYRAESFLEVAGCGGDPAPKLERRRQPSEDAFRVGLVAGGRWPLKTIPADVLSELARLFHDMNRAEVHLIGDRRDAARAEMVIERSGGRSGVFNFCGEGDTGALISRLEGLDLVISPDSGPAHLARALGVPTLVVFTSTSPELGFWSRDTKGFHMVDMVPCRPCHRHGGSKCPQVVPACRNRLVPREIHGKAMALL